MGENIELIPDDSDPANHLDTAGEWYSAVGDQYQGMSFDEVATGTSNSVHLLLYRVPRGLQGGRSGYITSSVERDERTQCDILSHQRIQCNILSYFHEWSSHDYSCGGLLDDAGIHKQRELRREERGDWDVAVPSDCCFRWRLSLITLQYVTISGPRLAQCDFLFPVLVYSQFQTYVRRQDSLQVR